MKLIEDISENEFLEIINYIEIRKELNNYNWIFFVPEYQGRTKKEFLEQDYFILDFKLHKVRGFTSLEEDIYGLGYENIIGFLFKP